MWDKWNLQDITSFEKWLEIKHKSMHFYLKLRLYFNLYYFWSINIHKMSKLKLQESFNQNFREKFITDTQICQAFVLVSFLYSDSPMLVLSMNCTCGVQFVHLWPLLVSMCSAALTDANIWEQRLCWKHGLASFARCYPPATPLCLIIMDVRTTVCYCRFLKAN